MRKPFFARFLEIQELDSVIGGKRKETMKYPSDSDEGVTERRVTLRYPSDFDKDEG